MSHCKDLFMLVLSERKGKTFYIVYMVLCISLSMFMLSSFLYLGINVPDILKAFFEPNIEIELSEDLTDIDYTLRNFFSAVKIAILTLGLAAFGISLISISNGIRAFQIKNISFLKLRDIVGFSPADAFTVATMESAVILTLSCIIWGILQLICRLTIKAFDECGIINIRIGSILIPNWKISILVAAMAFVSILTINVLNLKKVTGKTER